MGLKKEKKRPPPLPTTFPELVGLSGVEAKARLEHEYPWKTYKLEVVLLPEAQGIYADYRGSRVRLFVDAEGKVRQTPEAG
mmetsp:Transcript_4934/g.5483  ORF Transcript_4934/g.5483 Transcript_4934/m.5483 type:complete len:81 (+) Transcript_4934:108-350(+)